MNKTMIRLLALALLTMVSMGVGAKVNVEIGEFTGGKIIEKGQTDPDDKGLVTVTITVTPDKGYTISQKDIVVFSTYSPSGTRVDPQIAGSLTLLGKDPEDLGKSRDYSFIVASSLGVWVKEANFKSSGKGPNRNTVEITSLDDLTAEGSFIIKDDIDASGYESLGTFTGTLTAQAKDDGTFPVISNLTCPLFTTATDATISNIMFKEVAVSGTGYIGAVCGTADGATHIYNCGILPTEADGSSNSSVTSTDSHCGSLVGFLDGTARVVNCFSFATVAAGTANNISAAGIVGYNNQTTKAGSIYTMVMNCMFYGDITAGKKVSPVYGGKTITNLKHDSDRAQDGLNTFNYYAYTQLKTKKVTSNDEYKCALAVEDKFLNRFEFYRLLLNSNKKLAATYITGDAADANLMAKWVLDKSIAPYPILKAQGRYTSIINYNTANLDDYDEEHRNQGRRTGTLAVTIRTKSEKTDGGQSWPSDGDVQTTSLTLIRTDKDFDNFNYNYDKVQLPYYNDVGTGNCTENRVVTGWKITSITTVANDPYTSSNYDYSKSYSSDASYFEYPNYNFADRKSSNKDLYTVSGRVFSQGAYFDVPYGVTAIEIEPYWAKCAYISDPNYDVVYKTGYTDKQNVTQTGTQVIVGTTLFNGQRIETTVSNALGYINGTLGGYGSSVYDNAVVLVGNLHLDGVPSSGTNPFTIMSVDEDNDHEPDYSLIYHHIGRLNMCPIRFDFLTVPGTAQAQKPNGANLICNMTLCKTRGWFEITNTALLYFSQFEYENLGNSNGNDNKDKVDAPLILLGGVFDQFVSTQNTDVKGKVIYIHVGSNVQINSFGLGTHSDGKGVTPHVPVSVTGGDYDGFYLTGTYNSNATIKDDNAECYISGGRFAELAGAAQEQIGKTGSANNGNVRWQIYDADITEFFGGGINDAKPVQGNIITDIFNSHVTTFCGGPKFGNMATGKTVTTNAEGCTFGKFFGAGYGGNSISRKKYFDSSSYNWNTLQGYYTDERGKFYNGSNTDCPNNSQFGKKGPGVATDFDYEFFVWSSGTTGARFFVKFVSFSLAQCNDVNSTLKDCTINENFYGGGSLGKVIGTATSVLEDCTVKGNAFGAGYSATLPPIDVRIGGFVANGTPNYNKYSGMFEPGTPTGTEEYTWKQVDSYPSEGGAGFDGQQVITTQNLDFTNLGSVNKAILTIKGSTEVKGSVYGGGDESCVDTDTEVYVESGTIGTGSLGGAEYGNVFGGGKGKNNNVMAGLVKGDTKVSISSNPTIYHNVYGGGSYGSVGDFTYDGTTGMPNGRTSGGTCRVTITGGTIGTTGKENGMVFGSSRGLEGDPAVNSNIDKLAWVYDTEVTIGDEDSSPSVYGSVYGGGENGHNYHDATVTVHSGTIGITDKEVDDGPNYPNRGNVYGGGCGTDTYTGDDGKTYYNLNAGIVLGNCTVNIDGGHVVHNVYGAGAMGSAGTFTLDDDGTNSIPDGKPIACTSGGICYVNISGGEIGMPGAKMTATGGPDDYGHVFGGGRGEVQDSTEYVNMPLVGYVKETHVTISDDAFITGSVYGGSESGHMLGDTYVTVSGGQIGCGEDQDAAYSDDDFTNAFDETGNVTTPLSECAHWTYDTHNSPYDKYAGDEGYTLEAAAGGLKTATDGHTFYGNVFGGGSGYYPYAPGKWVRSAGLVEGSTHVLIEGGHILSNVYGGNEHTDVYGSCTVTMTGGTVGVPRTWSQKRAEPVLGNLFGAGKGDKRVLFNQWTNVASTTVTVSGGTVYGSVFGGGEDGHVLGDAETTISGASTIIGTLGTTGYDGNVFGGGRGSYTALTAGVVCGNVNLYIENGYMKGSVYGGGRLASVGTHLANISQEDYYGKTISDGKQQILGEDDVNAEGVTHGHISIVISGGTIGAVKDGRVLTSQYSVGDVFGGCKGTTEGTILEKLGIAKSAVVNLMGGTVGNSIYGGGEVGFVGERGLVDAPETAFAKVNLLGGSVKNVYGGGLGLKDGVGGAQSNAPALVRGNVKVNLNGLEPGDYNSNIHSSIVTGFNEDGNDGFDFYRVNNRVDGCVVTGNIFGCNNVNGTPEGHAKLHVFMTTPESRQLPEPGQTSDHYDVAAVYGGGNQADYEPTDSEQKTEVIIEGCGLTSIQQVYGGGNAAATPGTLVTIKGTELIDEVFGGGNGVSTDDFENPGANIGFVTGTETPYALGDGVALVRLMAGNIHYAYGGSNTKGDIRGGSSVQTVDNEWIEDVSTACCEELHVDEMYGGGKNAGMKSGTNIILGCSNSTNWVNEIYAGAENADVEGDCSLTITSGKFKRIFGGNKFSGKLKGSITVNIEENGQCGIPVIIGELYGGGNKAAYSVYGYDNNGNMLTSGERRYNDPVVNVRAFTSIGNIYGGGYGADAILYGNTNVNINETLNHQDDAESFSGNEYEGEVLHLVTTLEEVDVKLYPHDDGKIGVIGNVFGGGNAAAVYGNTNVNIGTTTEEPLQQLDNNGNPLYEEVVVNEVTTKVPVKVQMPVVGADIRGNVYGGGNEAIVTGDTNVVIGKDGSQ